VLRATWQAERGCRGAAPPWGTVLTGPGGVPRRGKGRTVPHGGRVLAEPHSSRGRSKEGGHLFPWRHPSQAFPRPVIQKRVDPLESGFSDFREGRLLGMQPADQSVGVLVRAALPGVIGSGEEHIHTGLLCQFLVPGKLFAVVEREAESCGRGQESERPADRRSDLLGPLGLRSIKKCEPRASLHQRHQVARLVRPVDQIPLPVPDARACLHLGWPGVDHAPVWNVPPLVPIVPRAASATLAVSTRKVLPQDTTSLGISVDVRVDRLLAHPRPPLKPSATTDHIGSPTVLKTALCVCFHLLSEAPRSRPFGPILCHFMRLSRLVSIPASVPGDLSTDRTRRTAQAPSYLSLPVPGLTPHSNQITFCSGHAFVSHYVLHVLLVHEERTLPRDHFHLTSVALATRARGTNRRHSTHNSLYSR